MRTDKLFQKGLQSLQLNRAGFFSVCISLFLFLSLSANANYLVKKEIHPGTQKEIILSVQKIGKSEKIMPSSTGAPVLLRSLPSIISEGTLENGEHNSSPTTYQEWLYPTLPSNLQLLIKQQEKPAQNEKYLFLENEEDLQGDSGFAQAEVRTLVEQGPTGNRINLVILGDGYTLDEKEKYFSDAKRITDGLFTGNTFASYLPLFNVYAVFVPSQDSGISDLVSKQTAFGLYRTPKGSKRAIMPGNTTAIERALSLAPVTADYPIIIANDDYYGGLGGRYAITTRSLQSGLVVLRHELGHNFGEVGEEYDGGQVYQGANSAGGMTQKWGHWLSPEARVYDAKLLSGAYVWQNLSKPYTARFRFPSVSAKGSYRFSLLLSTVGWSTSEDVNVSIDGQAVELEGVFTSDRSFFQLKTNRTLAPGDHTIDIRQNIADGDNVLAFANLYAEEDQYNYQPSHIAAYPNYNQWGSAVGYRPTHDGCLMRNMVIDYFCAVDKENMWLKFFGRIKLIDSVTSETVADKRKISLQMVPLEGIEIRWLHVQGTTEQELPEFRNQRTIFVKNTRFIENDLAKDDLAKDDLAKDGLAPLNLRVRVEFKTSEIRKPQTAITDWANVPL